MLSHRWFPWTLFAVVATLIAACGGDDAGSHSRPHAGASSSASSSGARTPSGEGACALLMQSEVDELFRTGVGAGVHETLDEQTELCSWPANEDAAMLVQVSPTSGDIRAAVDMGTGYDVVAIDGMKGPAAASVEQADGDGDVVVVAMAVNGKTVTLSPVGLGVAHGSERFERLKAILNAVADRL